MISKWMLNAVQRVDRRRATLRLVICLCLCCAGMAAASPAEAQNQIVVRPKEINDVLINPGMGFTTFQMFNGDNLSFHDVLTELDINQYGKTSNVENRDHPMTSIAYFRIAWRVLEPEPGKYRWDCIDGLLNLAHGRKQTLMLRISPYRNEDGLSPDMDVPDWYRKMVGPETKFVSYKWAVDPEDPRYAEYFGAMIKVLGERYDGHPDLESVDVSFVGSAGEGGGTPLLKEQTMRNLADPYIESFKKTPLIALINGKKYVEYMKLNAATPVGWRQDCLGDLGFWAKEQNGWTHMYDYYPETIINYGMQDAWKKGPVAFEICGVFDTWDSEQKYSDAQVQYIINQSLKWHMSSFNAKSSAVPGKWKSMVDDWQKKMGYRFVLRRFSYPATIRKNGKVDFESWWENKGVAPCYKDYQLAIRLKNNQHSEMFTTEARIDEWLPGDSLYDDALFPQELPAGEYEMQIAIVDKSRHEPKINLAIEGKLPDGWYSLGKISIQDK